MTDALFPEIERDAAFSPDGRYRWTLSRNWDIDRFESHCGWIMLNPSTADAAKDDPTIRRCMGYAKRWGFAGIHVMNLFAIRATEPADLRKAKNPIAPRGRLDEHDALLLNFIGACPLIIAAWGTHGDYLDRGKQVVDLLAARSIPLHCLRVSQNGHPCHPLYLPGDLTPTPFIQKERPPQ